jgi:hypothetical protein
MADESAAAFEKVDEADPDVQTLRYINDLATRLIQPEPDPEFEKAIQRRQREDEDAGM